MNYIKRLEQDKIETETDRVVIEAALNDLIAYLGSSKFAGPDNDYVHVSTDLMPKLLNLRLLALSRS